MVRQLVIVFAALALAGAALAAPTAAPAPPAAPIDASGPLPIDAFYQDAAIVDAELSPKGDAVALIRQDGDKRGVIVIDLATGASKVIYLNGNKAIYFTWVHWKGDQRLIVGVTILQINWVGGKVDGEIASYRYGKLMVAIDRDGRNHVALMKADRVTAQQTGDFLFMGDDLRSDPGHILAIAPTADGRPALWLTDIATGAANMLDKGDDNTIRWWIDRAGTPIARLEASGHDLVYQARAPGKTDWIEIRRVHAQDVLKQLKDFDIVGPAEKDGQVYVLTRPENAAQGAARTVRIFDTTTNVLSPPVWPALDYDISAIIKDSDTDALLGVCYWIDTEICDFKASDSQATFHKLYEHFGGDRSISVVSQSEDQQRWLIWVSGPTEPASYYLFDRKDDSVKPLGALLPELPAPKLGDMQRFAYKARDGTPIHAYVTRPPGAPPGPLPLVVIPHGGPEARDTFDFDGWSQIIATRGYLVLQPNFRGSSGYGAAFAEAGYGQWGAKMQDDITDGVQALIASGQVDPKRICIFGASYGGYAALIGGALQPDLYKCVVSWAGVSDLPRMMRSERGGLFGGRSPFWDYYLKTIGDPAHDEARLERTSAITYARSYGPPVLLIHGDADATVPVEQSRVMNEALKSAHKSVKLLIYKGEDHNGWSPEHEKAAINEVVSFIESQIAPAKLAPVAPPPDASASAWKFPWTAASAPQPAAKSP